MEVAGQTSLAIAIAAEEQSQVGDARRQALRLASGLDFNELRCGELAIVVTELARNLQAHGHGGELVITPWTWGAEAGLDVLALDTGGGIRDVGQAMEDGYSTSGTPGTGLGAIERMADGFELYTQPGKGTVVFARMLRHAGGAEQTERVTGPKVGSCAVPVGDETVSGDGWGASIQEGRSVYVMVDGLGHGPMAHAAAEEALRVFHEGPEMAIEEQLRRMHLALAKTRGAAVAMAEILPERGVVQFTGSGNIAAAVRGGGKTRTMVSMNGTPGHNLGTVRTFTYPWDGEAVLLMHSDGLGSRWNLDEYAGLAMRHPALLAGVLYRDFSRRRDDATVLVARG